MKKRCGRNKTRIGKAIAYNELAWITFWIGTRDWQTCTPNEIGMKVKSRQFLKIDLIL